MLIICPHSDHSLCGSIFFFNFRFGSGRVGLDWVMGKIMNKALHLRVQTTFISLFLIYSYLQSGAIRLLNNFPLQFFRRPMLPQ